MHVWFSFVSGWCSVNFMDGVLAGLLVRRSLVFWLLVSVLVDSLAGFLLRCLVGLLVGFLTGCLVGSLVGFLEVSC